MAPFGPCFAAVLTPVLYPITEFNCEASALAQLPLLSYETPSKWLCCGYPGATYLPTESLKPVNANFVLGSLNLWLSSSKT